MATDSGYLPRLQSREAFVDHLEGYTEPTVAELRDGRLTRKLLKTYMLETARHDHATPALTALFPPHVQLHRLDDTLYRVEDATHEGRVVGLLESLEERHPVFYTTLAADDSNKWVRQVVDRNPWLDRLWLSSPILFELWKYVQRTTPAHRYVRLGFEHEAWYETASDLGDTDAAEVDGEEPADDEAAQGFVERRRSKVALTERLGVLQEKLPHFLTLYDPMHSLVQLQIPSGSRGGHLLYHDGHATNRSDSFVEHRAAVAQVLGLYRRITEHSEDQLWVDTTEVGEDGFTVKGAPVTIQFRQPLSEATFNRFVDLGLERRTSRFRIGGYVTRRGPTKVHVAAIDRHLWQPFLLEVTSKQLVAVLPRGTCGNTIHRLVTNVQRLLDPSVDVWLGNERYETAVENSMLAAA
ncbi:hypothetical protein [Candidatus Poriferisodalis sp.]|uniref:hypothetical protein n=1 Tax=Candidatus Poriferisodalis sp. TaxID=3101277 RepID=UPI003AF7F55D